ncbi:MAG: response regulator [Verrucomicrobia bacterium]|jgi:PAS domain S-box-containing protein|nr:response regulator [Verrucomicrobiota bacterium]
MVNARVQTKWFLSMVSLLAILAALLVAAGVVLENRETRAESRERASSEAVLVANALRNDLYFQRVSGLRPTLRTIIRTSSFTRAKVLAPDGRLLVEEPETGSPLSVEGFGKREKGNFQPLLRVEGDQLLLKLPVVVNAGEVLGTLLLARTPVSVTATTRDALLRHGALGFTGWLLASVLAWALARRLAQPLRELEAATGKEDPEAAASLPVRSPDEIGQVTLAYKRIIHEREALKQRQRESSQHLAFILEKTPVGYIEWDPGFRVLQWNKAAEKIFGYRPEQAIGRTASELIIPEELKGEIAQVMHVLLRGEGGHENYNRNVRADGESIFCEWHNAVIRNRQGDISSVASVVLDVTETTMAQRKLKEALKTAREATEAKSRFLANMSHEIRTPMNGVIGLTELLLKTDLTAEQRDHLQVIHSSGQVLISIIKDILDLSKIESGAFTLAEEEFPLRESLQDSFHLFAGQLEEKQLEGICELEDDLSRRVLGDVYRLRQVIYNLLSNAIKFTEQGYVRMEAWVEETGADRLRLFVSITDTGKGINKEASRKVFEPFNQGDASSTRSHGGTGLGLSICRRLCQLMNGEIHLEHTSDRGTSFTFNVELKQASRKASAAAQANGEDGELPRDLKILLVEDNAVNRMVTKRILGELGYSCDTANDGKEAFDKVIQNGYDLLFMDLQMPVMDGFEATRKIRERFGQRPSIIALTASAVEGDREHCLKAGMDDYISKPIHIGEVRATILRLRDRRTSWL